MRHKYATRAIVLGRTPTGEESITASLLTEDFGLIRARSQGARKRGSKMSAGLQTLSVSDVMLLRAKDGWRMAGAVLDTNWSRELGVQARLRAARVFELADRLMRGEHGQGEIFTLLTAFLSSLSNHTDEEQEGLELLAVVRLLQALGFDDGTTYGASDDYLSPVLHAAIADRLELLSRINRGIAASGL